ncbi:PACE efflux transporter [Amaricoccus macauensis]|uniref:PACE efflux transporter n=1 Tax=Amaricoccus macauensis TaxID=57001 RepID=UPI003C7C46D5
MRKTFDRVRQAVAFEVIGVLVATPLFALVFDHSVAQMGGLALLAGTAATVWNFLYNIGFDRLLVRSRGSAVKSLPLRVVHAIGFEVTLLAILLPLMAWWLQISLVAALMMDLSFAAFYVVYTFAFTWGYDRLFPVGTARMRHC